jgi:hypothetical protein
MDFAVSNMNERASLVTNQSGNVGAFLNITLSATRTARDAIGTVVTVRTEAGEQRQQLLAGDGYMASNERVLQFGVGEADRTQDVTVEWPSGQTVVLRELPANVTVHLVEDCRAATIWRGAAGESMELP